MKGASAAMGIVLPLLGLVLAGCSAPPSEEAPLVLAGDWLVQGDRMVRVPTEGMLTPVAWDWSHLHNGTRPPALRLPPVDHAWQVDGIAFTGQFVTTRPAAAPEGSEGAFLFWVSVDDRFVSRGLATAPAELPGGSVRRAEVSFPMPVGGLHVPPGARLALHLGSQYIDSGERIFLQGGTIHHSGIRIDARPTDAGQGTWHTLLEAEGHSAVDCYTDPANPVRGFLGSFNVTGAQALRATVVRGEGPGSLDIDLELHGPGGLVAGTHAPDGNETLLLGPENLQVAGDGSWRVRAWCHSQQAPFSVRVEALR